MPETANHNLFPSHCGETSVYRASIKFGPIMPDETEWPITLHIEDHDSRLVRSRPRTAPRGDGGFNVYAEAVSPDATRMSCLFPTQRGTLGDVWTYVSSARFDAYPSGLDNDWRHHGELAGLLTVQWTQADHGDGPNTAQVVSDKDLTASNGTGTAHVRSYMRQ